MAAVDSCHVHFSSPPVSHIQYLPPASRYQDGLAAKIQKITNYNNFAREDETGHDSDDGDDLPPIEEVLRSNPPRKISMQDCNVNCNFENPDTLPLDINESCINLKQSRLSSDQGHNEGTQERPVILEDDEPDTSNLQAADVSACKPSERVDSLGRDDVWYDLENDRYVDGDGCPISQPEPDSSAAASNSAQERLSPHGNDTTVLSLSSESSSAKVEGKDEEKTEKESMGELEKDMLAFFEDQEKLSSATSSSCSQLNRRSAEPQQITIDLEDYYSGSACDTPEDAR